MQDQMSEKKSMKNGKFSELSMNIQFDFKASEGIADLLISSFCIEGTQYQSLLRQFISSRNGA
jgi:hypothetical protein